jgi:hypothetical protein
MTLGAIDLSMLRVSHVSGSLDVLVRVRFFDVLEGSVRKGRTNHNELVSLQVLADLVVVNLSQHLLEWFNTTARSPYNSLYHHRACQGQVQE